MQLKVRICVESPSKHSHIHQEHVKSVRKRETKKQPKPRKEDGVSIPSGTQHGYENKEQDLGTLVRLQEQRTRLENISKIQERGARLRNASRAMGIKARDQKHTKAWEQG